MGPLKRLALVLLALAIASGTALAQQQATVSFFAPILGDRQQFYDGLIAEFEASNPGIKVEFVGPIWENTQAYLERLVVLSAAGDMPDVIRAGSGLMTDLHKLGLLENLQPYVDRYAAELGRDDILPQTLDDGRIGDQIYGIPKGIEAVWVTYNIPAFEESGLPTPDVYYEQNMWNFDTVREAARKLTRRSEDGTVQRWGIFRNRALQLGTTQWLWGFGGEIFDENGAVDLDSPENVRALEFLWAMASEDRSMGVHGLAAPWGESVAGVVQNGRFGILPWWFNVVRDLPMDFDHDQVPFPAGPESDQTTLFLSILLVMSKASQNKEAAWKFIEFVSKEAANSPLAQNVPHRVSQIPAFVEDQMAKGLEGWRFFTQPRGQASFKAYPPVPDSVALAIDTVLREMFSGNMDVRTGALEATTRGNAAMNP